MHHLECCLEAEDDHIRVGEVNCPLSRLIDVGVEEEASSGVHVGGVERQEAGG